MSYQNDPTYLGEYDDICAMCGREQSVAVHENQQQWYCGTCEYENGVNEVE